MSDSHFFAGEDHTFVCMIRQDLDLIASQLDAWSAAACIVQDDICTQKGVRVTGVTTEDMQRVLDAARLRLASVRESTTITMRS